MKDNKAWARKDIVLDWGQGTKCWQVTCTVSFTDL